MSSSSRPPENNEAASPVSFLNQVLSDIITDPKRVNERLDSIGLENEVKMQSLVSETQALTHHLASLLESTAHLSSHLRSFSQTLSIRETIQESADGGDDTRLEDNDNIIIRMASTSDDGVITLDRLTQLHYLQIILSEAATSLSESTAWERHCREYELISESDIEGAAGKLALMNTCVLVLETSVARPREWETLRRLKESCERRTRPMLEALLTTSNIELSDVPTMIDSSHTNTTSSSCLSFRSCLSIYNSLGKSHITNVVGHWAVARGRLAEQTLSTFSSDSSLSLSFHEWLPTVFYHQIRAILIFDSRLDNGFDLNSSDDKTSVVGIIPLLLYHSTGSHNDPLEILTVFFTQVWSVLLPELVDRFKQCNWVEKLHVYACTRTFISAIIATMNDTVRKVIKVHSSSSNNQSCLHLSQDLSYGPIYHMGLSPFHPLFSNYVSFESEYCLNIFFTSSMSTITKGQENSSNEMLSGTLEITSGSTPHVVMSRRLAQVQRLTKSLDGHHVSTALSQLLHAAYERNVSLSNGNCLLAPFLTAMEKVFDAIANQLISRLNEINVEVSEVETTPNWSYFHACVTFFVAAEDTMVALKKSEHQLRVMIRQQLIQGSCASTAGWRNGVLPDEEIVAAVVSEYLDSCPSAQSASIQLRSCVDKNDSSRQLSFNLLKNWHLWLEKVQSLGFDAVVRPIRQNFHSMTFLDTWNKKVNADEGVLSLSLSVFNTSTALPQEYITSNADILLSLLTQLEPFPSGNTVKTTALSLGWSSEGLEKLAWHEWEKLAPLLGLSIDQFKMSMTAFSQTNESTNTVDDDDTLSHFVDDWTNHVGSAAIATYTVDILKIVSFNLPGTMQLSTDVAYFQNVLSALGIISHPVFNLVHTLITSTTEAELYENLADHRQTLRLMRAQVGQVNIEESSSIILLKYKIVQSVGRKRGIVVDFDDAS